MVAMLASRVALSCEPMKRSTLSSSISRTADLAVSAGGPPASVKSSLTGRPRMPPDLLTLSAASSAQARCVGPKSAAGPLRAMKKPTLNSLPCASARGSAPSAALPAAKERRRRRFELKRFMGGPRWSRFLPSQARRRQLRQHALDRRRDREQPRIVACGAVELDAQRQPERGQRGRQADAGNAGDAARAGV